MAREIWARVGMRCRVDDEEFKRILCSLNMTEEEFDRADEINFTDVLEGLFKMKGVIEGDSYIPCSYC